MQKFLQLFSILFIEPLLLVLLIVQNFKLIFVHLHLFFLSFDNDQLILLQFKIRKLGIAEIAYTIKIVIVFRKFAFVVRTLVAHRFVAFTAVMAPDAFEAIEVSFAEFTKIT